MNGEVKNEIAADINKIEYENAINELSKNYYNIGERGNVVRMYRSKTMNFFDAVSKADLDVFIADDYPALKAYDKKNKLYINVPEGFFSRLNAQNKIADVIESVDLFQKEAVKLEKVDDILYVIKNRMSHRTPDFEEVDKVTRERIINDYKEHFEPLDSVLDWMIACRFTSSRKESYLYLQMQAGFGKSFLKSILIQLGLFTEIKYSDIKSPTGLKPVSFKNTIGMVLDEFTIFKQEMKDWTNHMPVEAKNQGTVYCEVYAKVFLSADKSKSFNNGVSEQIIDRMNIIHLNGKLTSRPVYKESEHEYHNVIMKYIHDYIKNKIDSYLENGKKDAADKARKVIVEFYNKNKISIEQNLDKVIKSEFFAKIYELLEMKDEPINRIEKELKHNIIFSQKDNAVIISNPKKSFDLFLETMDNDFQAKAKYVSNEFEKILGEKVKPYRINGKQKKGLKFFVKDIMPKTEEEQREALASDFIKMMLQYKAEVAQNSQDVNTYNLVNDFEDNKGIEYLAHEYDDFVEKAKPIIAKMRVEVINPNNVLELFYELEYLFDSVEIEAF